jgi:hypothetical protein
MDFNYNSRKVDGTQTLAPVSAGQAQRFMEALANLRDDSKGVEQFQKQFAPMLAGLPDFWPTRVENLRVVPGRPVRVMVEFPPESQPVGEMPTEEDLAHHAAVKLGNLLFFLRSMVQSIWVAPNVREREFRVWTFHKVFLDRGAIRFLATPGVFDHVAPPPPFEQAFLNLLKVADRARYCGNPECTAPYFFAKRRSQKYCSDACSQPAQREFKQQWWLKVGKARREARRRAQEKARAKRQRGKHAKAKKA